MNSGQERGGPGALRRFARRAADAVRRGWRGVWSGLAPIALRAAVRVRRWGNRIAGVPGVRLGRAAGLPAGWRMPGVRRLALVATITALATWGVWERCGWRGCPNVARLVSYQPGRASVLLDRAGEPLADLAPVDRRVVRLDSLPAYVPAAFVAVEDKRFYRHGGVDWRRVVGAALADLRAGGFVQGFSTITMQLARNVFPDRLPGRRRTIGRKLLEIRVAREIEERFTKPEILELYLNHIYFGGGAYGIEAAARYYFHVPARRLTLAQAALLAALPKAPSAYDPRRHPARAERRRNLVLRLMEEQGYVEAAEAEAARARRLGVRREPPHDDREPGPAPYFVEVVRRELEARFGDELYATTLRIHTTLDRRVQRVAEEELERQLGRIEAGAYGRFRGERYRPDSGPWADATPYVQGAVVVLDVETGDVVALVGGRDFRHSRFDRAVRARRQAGSAFKPFVYAVALREGYAPSQRIADAPLRMELEGGEVWEPRNFSGEFEGTLTLRDALVRSKNLPTVRLAATVGVDEVAELARDAGVRSPIPELPSTALGVAAVSPLELTAAYAAFANGGEAVRPRLVRRVEDEAGEAAWEPEPERRRVLDPGVAYLLTDLLRDAVDRGTGVAVRRAGYRGPAAGKTGTTDDGTDAWFVGYTPELAAGVWIGFDRPRPVVERATGGRLAAPVWGRLMRRIHDGREPPGAWRAPATVVERRVDPETGLVLEEGCRPERGRAGTELFLEGLEPAATCPRGGGEREGGGLLAWLFDGIGSLWRQATEWLARHVGRETDVPPPSERDRFLGAPRLPRGGETPEPEVPPEIFEAPSFEERIRVPDFEPPAPETVRSAAPETARPAGPVDTVFPIPPPPDTGAPDAVVDTVFPLDTLPNGGRSPRRPDGYGELPDSQPAHDAGVEPVLAEPGVHGIRRVEVHAERAPE